MPETTPGQNQIETSLVNAYSTGLIDRSTAVAQAEAAMQAYYHPLDGNAASSAGWGQFISDTSAAFVSLATSVAETSTTGWKANVAALQQNSTAILAADTTIDSANKRGHPTSNNESEEQHQRIPVLQIPRRPIARQTPISLTYRSH